MNSPVHLVIDSPMKRFYEAQVQFLLDKDVDGLVDKHYHDDAIIVSHKRRLSTDTAGRLTSISALLILVLGLFAWFVRVPATHAAARPTAGFWQIATEAGLAATFILGLETMVISLIPLRYLEGPKLTAWRVSVWVAVFGIGLFAFVHLLLQPSSGYVAVTTDTSRWTAILLFVGFGLFSAGFWAYFRFRKPRGSAAK